MTTRHECSRQGISDQHIDTLVIQFVYSANQRINVTAIDEDRIHRMVTLGARKTSAKQKEMLSKLQINKE
jgi:hypothetical protein